jgi:hypothetical protein
MVGHVVSRTSNSLILSTVVVRVTNQRSLPVSVQLTVGNRDTRAAVSYVE